MLPVSICSSSSILCPHISPGPGQSTRPPSTRPSLRLRGAPWQLGPTSSTSLESRALPVRRQNPHLDALVQASRESMGRVGPANVEHRTFVLVFGPQLVLVDIVEPYILGAKRSASDEAGHRDSAHPVPRRHEQKVGRRWRKGNGGDAIRWRVVELDVALHFD